MVSISQYFQYFIIISLISLGPESKKDEEQRQVYVIRWRPSQCSVDPIEEIILYNDDKYEHAVIGMV